MMMTEKGQPIASLETPFRAAMRSVDRLYDVFKPYRRPDALSASPVIDNGAMLAALRRASLRQLTAEDLGEYASRALTTVGDDRDYRHFLPRILELALTDGNESIAAQHVGLRLALAGWRAWPAEEVAALTEFFDVSWPYVLSRHPGTGSDAADWLVARGCAGLSAKPALEMWERPAALWTWLHLAHLVETVARGLERHGTLRSWRERGVADGFIDEVVAFLHASAGLEDRLFEAGLAAFPLADDERETLAHASDRLTALRLPGRRAP
jgi:hypothetical protein